MRNIIFDLDGTLLEKDSSLSSESIKCLQDLSKNNIITIATGRSIAGLPSSLSQISNCISYYITLNGSSVYDKQFVAIYKNPINNDNALSFIKDILEYDGVIVELFADEQWHIGVNYITKLSLLGIKQSTIDYILATRIKHNDFINFVANQANCVEKISVNVLRGKSKKDILDLVSFLCNKYNLRFNSDNPHKIDIYEKTTNKGSAIKYLNASIGINNIEIISFGNDENDIEMFEASGISICMSLTPPDVKRYASIILRKDDGKRILRSVNLLKKRGMKDLC